MLLNAQTYRSACSVSAITRSGLLGSSKGYRELLPTTSSRGQAAGALHSRIMEKSRAPAKSTKIKVRFRTGFHYTDIGRGRTKPVAQRVTEGPSYNQQVEFSLREFRSDDFETLWAIDQQCFPPGISYSRPELQAYMRRPRSLTLVAESASSNGKSGSTLGFIVAEASSRGVGHIITIDVVAEGRRFGIGSHLLTSAEARLCAANCHAVMLEVAVNNLGALAFYKRHHYDVLKTIPHYYSDGVDALVLGKRLADDMKSPRTGN